MESDIPSTVQLREQTRVTDRWPLLGRGVTGHSALLHAQEVRM